MTIPEPTDHGHDLVQAMKAAFTAHDAWRVAMNRVNDDLARDGKYVNSERVRNATKHVQALEQVYNQAITARAE